MESSTLLTQCRGLRVAAVWSSLALCCLVASAGEAPGRAPPLHPAERVAHAAQATMLAGASAGKCLVAVGDHGVVLLSDDQGRSWRQARDVPADVPLTAVSFADERRGWVVGHWGLVLRTQDGAETWQVQRQATQEDRPLFGVHFRDARHGVAVGLWSLVLITDDGGATWRAQTLKPPEGASKADVNLNGLFADEAGTLYAPAERGLVLRSMDGGATWSYLSTGFKGSLWTGIALQEGTLLVAGLRGAIYRSTDHGASWSRIQNAGSASITALALRTGTGAGEVVAAAVDGGVLVSRDGGMSFQPERGDPRPPLTGAVSAPDGRMVLLSRQGPVQ